MILAEVYRSARSSKLKDEAVTRAHEEELSSLENAIFEVKKENEHALVILRKMYAVLESHNLLLDEKQEEMPETALKAKVELEDIQSLVQ